MYVCIKLQSFRIWLGKTLLQKKYINVCIFKVHTVHTYFIVEALFLRKSQFLQKSALSWADGRIIRQERADEFEADNPEGG